MNRVLTSILSSIWLIEKGLALSYLPAIVPFLKGEVISTFSVAELELKNTIQIEELPASSNIHVISEYGESSSPEMAGENSIALITLTGAMSKHDQSCGGPAGAITKNNILQRCFANDKIKGVFIYTDGPGGHAAAPERISKTIQNRNKPVMTFIDGLNCSAHYWATAGSDKIFALSEMDRIGSIGAYTTMVDFSEALEKEGIKLTELYASQSSEKNKDYRDALNGDFTGMQKNIDFLAATFISNIKSVRGERITDDGKVFKGKDYNAKEALEIGLIDGIISFDAAMGLMEEQIVMNEKLTTKTFYA